MRLKPVKKAYEQIADQLRELILAGRLRTGARLPTEHALAAQFGVSRTTVREALRVLATEGLLLTAKGTGGGSYVTQPSVEDISQFLRTSIGLLSRSEGVSLEEFLEARELLEVPAARLAALRHSPGDLDRLRAAIPTDPETLNAAEQFVLNREFHSTIVDICANTILTLAAQPVFIVLQTHLVRTALDHHFHASISEHHSAIAMAIEVGDADRAASEMAAHLAWLRPIYERTWLEVRRGT